MIKNLERGTSLSNVGPVVGWRGSSNFCLPSQFVVTKHNRALRSPIVRDAFNPSGFVIRVGRGGERLSFDARLGLQQPTGSVIPESSQPQGAIWIAMAS